MERTHIFGAIIIACVSIFDMVKTDFEHLVTNPEPILVSFNFETLLTCEMNIEPDKFQWKFYPTNYPFSTDKVINLSNATFQLVPKERYDVQKKRSELPVRANSTDVAGDYQCLAYYGAFVVASVPWQLRIAVIRHFPQQQAKEVTVTAGNTVSWRCIPPESNPEAYIDYYKNDEYIAPVFPKLDTKSLILPNVDLESTGLYKCGATNNVKTVNSSTYLNLKVVRNGPIEAPYFIIQPRSTYVALKGSTVFLDCSAIGTPVPTVVWLKQNVQLPPDRTQVLPGGLKITNVSSTDDGIYICKYTNAYGSISHQITLIYNEEPSIDCFTMNVTDVKQNENLDIECAVTGTPEPYISWFLNGFSVNNDTGIEAVRNRIYFRPAEKRHAGNLQIFARNRVKTVYNSITVRVIPLTSSVDPSVTPPHQHHRHRGKASSTRKPPKHSKSTKMIPPSKPVISRLNDEAVVVRWDVPNNNGLPIQFFKVQYRELGPANSNDVHSGKGSRWKTINADIPPNIKASDITNLKPDHVYKFRVAAVYSNNDNKLSPNSEKFHLKRMDFDERNPLPVPLITRTEPVNATSTKIYWECVKLGNVSVDGFYISYMSASTAGDYMKATVDGESVREYVITHLQSDTIYDVKIQSFNSKYASDFSPIMKARTSSTQSTSTTGQPPLVTADQRTAGFANLYIIIGVAVVGCTLLVAGVVSLFLCRKWQKNKSDKRDKSTVDDRHIQAEGNEYVEYGQKSIPRANGCVLPSNRITITPNPLADADNKNQNMIEMSRLTAQNNNCASIHQESSSGASANATVPDTKHRSNRKGQSEARKNRHSNVSSDNVSSGENYV